MNLVEIEAIGLQAAQTCFALLNDVTTRRVLLVGVVVVPQEVHLRAGRNPSVVTVALQGLAGEFLASSARIGIRRIENIDAGVDRVIDDADRVVSVPSAVNGAARFAAL